MNPNYECDDHHIPMDEIERKQISRTHILRTFRCPVCKREKIFVEYGWI